MAKYFFFQHLYITFFFNFTLCFAKRLKNVDEMKQKTTKKKEFLYFQQI